MRTGPLDAIKLESQDEDGLTILGAVRLLHRHTKLLRRTEGDGRALEMSIERRRQRGRRRS